MMQFKMAMVLFFIYIGCVSTAVASGAIPVYVSIVPQKYFVEKIGGKLVDVSVMVEPGANPANYEPRPRQMIGLSKTIIYYAVGVPFEKTWLKKIASVNPEMLIAHTEEGIKKIPMKSHHHEEDVHDKEEEHHHGILDPHIWLSPPLVRIQADNILKSLIEVDPTHRPLYETNHRNFRKEIDALDAEIREIFAEKGEGLQFMVFHPAYGYFAQAYGLTQVPVEIEGKSPKPAELGRLIKYARKHGIRVIFVQPQFSTKKAGVIAKAIRGQITFADPLAGNWAENLRQVAAKFKAALK